MPVGQHCVASLHIHPVKGSRAIDVSSVRVHPRGFEGDRRWMVVNSDNRFMSQRETPLLSRLIATVRSGGLELSWSESPDVPVCRVEQPTRDLRTVTIWKDVVHALDAGNDAAAWLSARLGESVRLVHMHKEARRAVDPEFGRGHDVSFADGYPVLIVGTASLARLVEETGPLPMNRFRPNLVVQTDVPWEEDQWTRMSVGTAVFRLVKPSARCVVTTIDQQTGIKGVEPLPSLARIRKRGSKVLFGMNAVVETSGVVSVGDRIDVGTFG